MKKLTYYISFLIVLSCIDVNASDDITFDALYEHASHSFGTESLESSASLNESNVAYRFYAFGESENGSVYTLFIYPQADLDERYRNYFYQGALEKPSVLQTKTMVNGVVSENEVTLGKNELLSFLSLLGSSEVFELPKFHAEFEPQSAIERTGGNSFILFERHMWGEEKQVFRLGPAEMSPAALVINWLLGRNENGHATNVK